MMGRLRNFSGHVAMELEAAGALDLRNTFNEHKYALRSIYFSHLLQGNLRAIRQFDERMAMYNIPLQKRRLYVMVIRMDGHDPLALQPKIAAKELLDLAVMNIIDETLRMENQTGCSFLSKNNTYAALFNLSLASTKVIRETLFHVATQVAGNLLTYLNMSVSIGIDLASTELSRLGQQYEEAVGQLKHKQFYGARAILLSQDLFQAERTPNAKAFDRPDVADLIGLWIKGEYNCFYQTITDFLYRMEMEQCLSEEEIKAFCLDMMYMLLQTGRHLLEGRVRPEVQETVPYEMILRMTSFRQLKLWLLEQIKRRIHRMENGRLTYTEPIRQAFSYMSSHYEQDLSLQQVADKVHLNKTYLSELFKKETGMSFTDYLTRLRIAKAKELIMLGDCKIGDLAERVGYPNGSYFTRVFKKITGVTPLHFKQSTYHRSSHHGRSISRSSL